MKRIYEFKDQYDAKFLQIYSGNQKCNSCPSNIEWWRGMKRSALYSTYKDKVLQNIRIFGFKHYA